MTDFGVTPGGFVVKPFADILNAKVDLARSVFGPDVDLRSTSALRKILDIASAEDQEHWKALEGAYYANFISTASSDALNVLGDDLGLQRANQHAAGQVTFTLANEAPGRNYILPIGTLVETAAPVVRFRTTNTAVLSSTQKTATLPATAVLPARAATSSQARSFRSIRSMPAITSRSARRPLRRQTPRRSLAATCWPTTRPTARSCCACPAPSSPSKRSAPRCLTSTVCATAGSATRSAGLMFR